MTTNTHFLQREEIIETINAQLDKKIPAKSAKLIRQFINDYYATMALDDLRRYTITDLYGAVINLWHFIFEREPRQAKIRVYNPRFEQHGWESTHTIVEINYDDMPFLVDSLRMEINRQGFGIYNAIHFGGFELKRNAQHQIIEILGRSQQPNRDIAEAVLHFEIDRQTDETIIKKLETQLHLVLADVTAAVDDWQAMRTKMEETLEELAKNPPPCDKAEVAESIDFLRWANDNHFTFLGCRDYMLIQHQGEPALQLVSGSGLGILANESHSRKIRLFSDIPPSARELYLAEKNILILAKTNTLSTVHRRVYTDYIGVKRFNDKCELIGERRFIGLYTTAAYHSDPRHIPFLRHKVDKILEKSGLSPQGHAGKDLLNILQTLPRDDLLQGNSDELYELAMGILQLQERRVVRFFVRKDSYGRFISCYVYVPRDEFNNNLRQAFQKVLQNAFSAEAITFDTYFSESILARIHFFVRINSKKTPVYNVDEIEAKLIETSRTWKDQLRDNLLESYGEEKGLALYHRYAEAFPVGYQDDFHSRSAVSDIGHIEHLNEQQTLTMHFYHAIDEEEARLGFKLFHAKNTIPLSDVIPIFENLGLRVIGERPYEVRTQDEKVFWVDDFTLVHANHETLDIDKIKQDFQEAFAKVWYGLAENDGFNRLVLSAHLNWRQVMILRAYAKYLRQTGFMFSQVYIEETLSRYPRAAELLVELFAIRFDVSVIAKRNERVQATEVAIKQEIEKVTSLDEDRILRRYLDVIRATLRTNYFQMDAHNRPKSYFSFKLNPAAIPELPLPLPMVEVFVYSPRFEAVHLRSSKVARGGIRWSDRREDFRTEVLGLMKAQKVKNSVIVPSGAKGGFVPKCLPQDGNREDVLNEAIDCYKNFMRGLLDITDNLVQGKVVPPQHVLCYDDNDPYLVVAADKGTASFSDIANSISAEYAFWLSDAFASGGSVGYDHKKMGITARGAWESVKRHFRELKIDIQHNDFTVVGIGDMSGDVFGNGMLCSKNIKLVAAFDHRHIFLDPNPDAASSFVERERLFQLPRSSWEDYNPQLISAGGGVFKRASKSISLSPQVQERFGLSVEQIAPNEFIKILLKANVDLLWNGGIGTYVKASMERHADVGDRTNDFVRVNGNELRARVIGEGGNLGCTQLGRVEYALNSGNCNTDFIDNSAGVDCSDHEVNIKILLNEIVASGDLTEKQRNVLLAQMTDEIAELVLKDNYDQTLAISIALAHTKTHAELYRRYLNAQEQAKLIDRSLEFLPSDKEFVDRRNLGQTLTRPELAVLLSYSKINLKHNILETDLPEDPYIAKCIETAFPATLRKRYPEQVASHRLRREIIATQLSNSVINEMGPTFVHRLADEMGVNAAEIVRAYVAAAQIFRAKELQMLINSLDYQIPAMTQLEMLLHVKRLVRRATRWLLRHRRTNLDITDNINYFAENTNKLNDIVPALMVGVTHDYMQKLIQQFVDAGLPEGLASRVASCRAMYMALNIVDVATQHQFDLFDAAKAFFGVGAHLDIVWFRDQLNADALPDYWDSLARASLRDDLDVQQRLLTISIMQHRPDLTNMDERIDSWKEKYTVLMKRWFVVLASLRSAGSLNFTMFFVAARELSDLTKLTLEKINSKGSKKVK